MSDQNTVRARKPSDATRAEAAAWIARLHGPQRSQDLEEGLRRWLAEDIDNARAFERMTEAWEAATAVSTRSHFPRVAAWKRPARFSWLRAASAGLAFGLAALATYVWWGDVSYATDIGEQRMVRLEDGSRVSLNSASRVVVDYRGSRRRVRLEKGEAFFEVASNPRRPFIVVAGDREVTALGTRFSVRYEPSRLAVMLVEGKVTVSAVPQSGDEGFARRETLPEAPQRAPNATRSITLAPGQRLILTAAELPQLDTPRADAITAWRRGEVVLDKTALANAVAEMNRYDETQMVIDDPRIAGLLISGIYRTGDSAGFAQAVSRMYDIPVSKEGDSIHLGKGALAK